ALGGIGCGTEKLIDKTSMLRSPLGMSAQGIAFLYMRPPVTTTEYLASIGEKAGLVPKAYAQGITFSRLSPIYDIWKALRDLSFAALSIILLFDGFIIMFRQKINPQTVAKIENTIPNIIITMILIAFSLPMAAFIIDLMYVAIAAGIGLIGTAVGAGSGNSQSVATSVQNYTTGGFGTLFSETFRLTGPFWDTYGQSIAGGTIGGGGVAGLIIAASAVSGTSLLMIPLALIGGSLIGAGTSGQELSFMTALSPIFMLLMLIYLLFLVFRLFFILLSCYIQILTSIIFAPVLLLWNAMPGQESFSSWWRGIVGNCLAFVITALMLYTGWAINWQIANNANTPFWSAPFVSFSGSPVSQLIVGLISIGIAQLIPDMIKKTKELLKAKPAFQMSPGMLGQPFGATLGKAQEMVQNIHVLKSSGIAERIKGIDKIPFLGPLLKH
ncbi:MAG: hypothetical protein NUV52_04640, partial [Candidatus Roizmanbacteria bacterium]|nr:hypothetical protein [Candidatus Roizmanbacteria bacterium]